MLSFFKSIFLELWATVLIIGIVAFLLAIGSWLIILVLATTFLFVVLQALGVPFKVSQKGVHIGTLRRLRYYRVLK